MRMRAVALIAAWAVASWWPCPIARPCAAQSQDDLDRVVASIDGDPITVHDLKTFAAVNMTTLTDRGDLNSPETKAVLKGVISERLLESEVKKYKDQVEDRQVDEYISNFERGNGITDDQLRTQLQAQGHTYEEFRKHSRLELQKMIMIQKEVRGKGQYLTRRRSRPTTTRILRSLASARNLQARADPASRCRPTPRRPRSKQRASRPRASTSNCSTAPTSTNWHVQYSDDDSKSQGGELGDFSRGDMIDPIQNAIDHMKAGDNFRADTDRARLPYRQARRARRSLASNRSPRSRGRSRRNW